MINVIFSTFFIDIGILFAGLVVWFLLYSIKNKRTKSNTAGSFFHLLRSSTPVFVKWFVIIFIIHSICRLYGHFINFIQENVNYDSVPVLALLFDLLKSLFTFVGPFIFPVIIALSAIVVLYGIFATMDQYSARASLKSDILDANSKIVALYNTNGSLAEDDEIESDDEPEIPVRKSHEKKHKRKLPSGCIHSFFNNSCVCFFKIAKFLPKIFLVVAICIGANAVFLNVKNVANIVNNQKKINELNMTIKNLSRAEAVAEISLVNEVNSPNATYPIKTYRISVLDDDGDPIENQTQEFTLEGNQLAIDTMNINFDYSEISKGEHYNIAYPYRIHSDVVTSENGIPFKCFSEDGTSYPVMYGLENDVVYSMDRNTYYQNLTEIFDIAKDEARAAEFGIRSFVGQDIHEPIYDDETYRLIVTGTGGVKLSKVAHLDVDDEEEAFSDEEISDMYKVNKGDKEEPESEKKGFFATAKDKIGGMFN